MRTHRELDLLQTSGVPHTATLALSPLTSSKLPSRVGAADVVSEGGTDVCVLLDVAGLLAPFSTDVDDSIQVGTTACASSSSSVSSASDAGASFGGQCDTSVTAVTLVRSYKMENRGT